MEENVLYAENIKTENELLKGRIGNVRVKKYLLLIIFIPIILIELFFILSIFLKPSADNFDLIGDSPKVALIELRSEITSSVIEEQIELFEIVRKNESVKEVIYIINSPGGSPAASEEMSEYLKIFQKDKKVEVYVQDIAASGGYYIASAVKKINVNENSIIGSIGVILPLINIEKLAEKVGVSEDFIAVGEYKVPVSMFKKTTEKQRDYMKTHLLNPTYETFVRKVAENRGKKVEDIMPFAEGKVFVPSFEGVKGVLYDEIATLQALKEKKKVKYGKELSFVKISPKEEFKIFPIKINFEMSPHKLMGADAITLG